MIEVIGAGFGRTGTASLKAALEELGYGPCYHMFEVLGEPRRAEDWIRAGDGLPVDWDEVFTGYRSTVDWPGASYWRELSEHYPKAKVVLTVRDPDRWFDSAASTVFRLQYIVQRPWGRPLRRLVPLLSPGLGAFLDMNDRAIRDRVFGGRYPQRREAVERFRAHIDEVRDAVPEDRLLVYDVADGWEPLCDFLGTEVPDAPFPSANASDDFGRTQIGQVRRRLALPAAAALGAAAVGAAAAGRVAGPAAGAAAGALVLAGAAAARTLRPRRP
ncbi:sulfotransferase family protein [Nocardiopsis sp. RSe5-2]|uniref:Sulfotransferase family protein n=1 Tax=Nocardiopsis endophytica TaxID=3018445 RepID=A0ABT4U9P8_9ACTN|nr:sulfotransferase family protein [Nocardiopsis endophytica]MDA2813661.1 sulfotransferase family protein [Nocardiopsis endophytica]